MYYLTPDIDCGFSIIDFFSYKTEDATTYGPLQSFAFTKFGCDTGCFQRFIVETQDTQSTVGLYNISYRITIKSYASMNATYDTVFGSEAFTVQISSNEIDCGLTT